jgi:hypothetical protein
LLGRTWFYPIAVFALPKEWSIVSPLTPESTFMPVAVFVLVHFVVAFTEPNGSFVPLKRHPIPEVFGLALNSTVPRS